MSVPLPFTRLHCGIDVLFMSCHAHNTLRYFHVNTIAELISLSARDLMRMPNFGAKCVQSVEGALAELGLTLAESPPPPPRPLTARQAWLRSPLSSRERDVLILRHGLNGESRHTWKAIGERLHVRAERARQIASWVEQKMRTAGQTLEEVIAALSEE